MAADSPLVKINTDPPERIAALYDVSARMAQRIVAYRDAHGPFHGPVDLAQVEGVSRWLAETLDPHIDWTELEVPKPPKKRQWGMAVFFGLMTLSIPWVLVYPALLEMIKSLPALRAGVPGVVAELWGDVSLLLLGALGVGVGYNGMCWALTTNAAVAHRLFRRFMGFSGLTVVAMISAVVASLVWYQTAGVERSPWDNQAILVRTAVLFFISLLVGPYLLVLWWPSLRLSPWLARAHDAGVILGGPLCAGIVWVVREVAAVWALILIGGCGLFFFSRGLRLLRTGTTLFDPPSPSSHGEFGVARWFSQRWLNEEQEQALKRHLDEKYPPSKVRTVGGVIAVGAGLWILQTVVSAILGDYALQVWRILFPPAPGP